MKKLLKPINRVEQILRDYPVTRDNDVTLLLMYLSEHHGLSDAIGHKNIRKLEAIMKEAPAAATIHRCRRKIQEEGLYQGKHRGLRLVRAADIKENINQ